LPAAQNEVTNRRLALQGLGLARAAQTTYPAFGDAAYEVVPPNPPYAGAAAAYEVVAGIAAYEGCAYEVVAGCMYTGAAAAYEGCAYEVVAGCI